jgi:hypothetical protein
MALLAAGAGLGTLIFHLRADADRASRELQRAIRMYDEMGAFRRIILSAGGPRRKVGASVPGEDVNALLAAKARQAQLPMNALSISRGAESKQPGWKETAYLVNLRAASKEAAIPRAPLVDFFRMVEEERATLRSKTLTVLYAGDNLASVQILFSSFQAE